VQKGRATWSLDLTIFFVFEVRFKVCRLLAGVASEDGKESIEGKMTAPVPRRVHSPALDITVSTVVAPGLGTPNGIFVLADGTRLASAGHSLRLLAPSGLVPAGTFAGNNGSSGKQDGPGADARFNIPTGIAVDTAGRVVVADRFNHSLRLVSQAGAVSRAQPRVSMRHTAWWCRPTATSL